MKKKKMNYAVEFWRFVCCMIFIMIHVYIIYPTIYWHIKPWVVNGHVMFKGSLDVIIIFYLITGYFLMRTYRKKKLERKEGEEISATKEAGSYLVKRLKSLYPAFLICLAFGLVLTNIYNDIPFAKWIWVAIDSFWEWAGAVLTGLGIGNNYYGLMSEGKHLLMNGPLWFISCLFIIGYVIYFLITKWEDIMIGLVFPIGFLIVYGYFHLNNISPMWYNFVAGGISQAALQAFVCIGMGCVYYVLIEKLQEKKFKNSTKIWLTIVNVLCSCLVIYHMIIGTTLTFATINGLCMVFVFLTLLNKDYFTKLLDMPIWKYPGKMALYIYMLHYPIIGVLYKLTGIKNLHVICITTYCITILLSIFLMLFMDYVVTPKLQKKKKQ